MLKCYGYMKCSTCRKALKWLDEAGEDVQFIDITEKPPSKAMLKAILKTGDYAMKDLLNKSGVLYREMKMKDRIPTMTEAQAVDLLAKHGKLCKRPMVTDGTHYTVGFDADRFGEVWG